MKNQSVIDSLQPQDRFQIGHDQMMATTFLPDVHCETYRDFETGLEK